MNIEAECLKVAITALQHGRSMASEISIDETDGRYFVAIDLASDKEDHYVEGVFRVDESGITTMSIKRKSNEDAIRSHLSQNSNSAP